MNFYKDLANKTKAIEATSSNKEKDKKVESRGSVAAFVDIVEDLKEAKSNVEKLENENKQLRVNYGKSLVIAIDNLISSPLQTRKLDTKRVSDLAEHLANNELTTPVVVRPSSTHTDKFEIIAGHHRVEAFKKLGRTEIEAIIRPMDDEEAEKRIFFDNLMAPDLPDFEKYKGFAALRKRTGQSYDALAKDAGISKTLVTYYFSFEKLPAKALNVLNKHPGIVGANAAQKIATLKADETKIVTALQKVVSGELDQKRIIAFLKNDEMSNTEPKNKERVFRRGEETVCTLQNKSDRIFTLTFNKGFDTSDWYQKITAFIEQESSAHSSE